LGTTSGFIENEVAVLRSQTRKHFDEAEFFYAQKLRPDRLSGLHV